jgi:flagellar biosynthesis protein FlhF
VPGADGSATKLEALAAALAFGEAQPLQWQGRAAQRSVAETRVVLAAGAQPVRLLVERITDARTGKLLAQRHVFASTTLIAGAGHVLQWQAWRVAVQPCFRLLRNVQQHLAATGFADAQRTASVRIAQAVTTTWRLQQSDAPWAPTTRMLLAQLAGHRMRAGRAVPATALFEGMGRLCVLLDAQSVEETVPPAPVAVAECV